MSSSCCWTMPCAASQSSARANSMAFTKSLFISVLTASPEPIHQSKDAFADLEQFLPRFRNHCLWQELLRRDRLQACLRLVQMIQRAFQIRNRKRVIGEALATGEAVQR